MITYFSSATEWMTKVTETKNFQVSFNLLVSSSWYNPGIKSSCDIIKTD